MQPSGQTRPITRPGAVLLPRRNLQAVKPDPDLAAEPAADAIAAAMAPRVAAGLPLHILIDGDIALTPGHILRDELRLGVEMIVIDGIMRRTVDFIALGRLRLPSLTVPVTIKPLPFADQAPDGARTAGRVHFRAPVRDAEGRVVAAVGLAGPRLRLRKRDFPALAEQVITYANRLSERLGYEAGQPIYVRVSS